MDRRANTHVTAGMRSAAESVVELWRAGGIDTNRLWLFAYEDGGHAYLPRVRDDADRRDMLTENVWLEKRRLITDVYGYGPKVGKRGVLREKKDSGALTRHEQQQSVQD
jgi:hypothetical protein